MKKFAFALAATAAFAAPALAQEAPADPFVATQDAPPNALIVVGGLTALVVLTAGSDGSSSGTN